MVDFSKSNSHKLELFSIDNERELDHIEDTSYDASKLETFDEAQLKGLNDQQSKMVSDISAYLSDSSSSVDYFTVQGGGGTGKSFSINRALEHINPKRIIAAAPSHFAKNVLKNFLGEQYKVTTVAALLGLRVSYDDEGKQIMIPQEYGTPPIVFHSVILIDEGSMLDDETAERILDYTRHGRKKLIILGDYCQLPPVAQDHDSVFFTKIRAELTQPMRFTGAIYDLTSYVREEIHKIRDGLIPTLNVINARTDRKSLIEENGSGYVFVNNTKTVLEAAIRRFKKGYDVDYVRILAYRNKTIEKINHHIRTGLYGKDSDQFEIGELLISEGGYTVSTESGKAKQIINNGEMFKVTKATPIIGQYGIECVELEFEGKTYQQPILTLSTEGKAMYNKMLSRAKRIAKQDPSQWKAVFKFKEAFAEFKYSYATSIHKAQGSTIQHVFIMEDDIYAVKPTTVKEKLQSLYVAISRASFRVYIHNKNFPADNSEMNREYLKKDYI